MRRQSAKPMIRTLVVIWVFASSMAHSQVIHFDQITPLASDSLNAVYQQHWYRYLDQDSLLMMNKLPGSFWNLDVYDPVLPDLPHLNPATIYFSKPQASQTPENADMAECVKSFEGQKERTRRL